jgi:hypothetical protein
MYSWDEQTAGLINWFLSASLAALPFRLRTGVEVTNPQRFYASLRIDIEQGVDGARARSGALQKDLECVFDRFGAAE